MEFLFDYYNEMCGDKIIDYIIKEGLRVISPQVGVCEPHPPHQNTTNWTDARALLAGFLGVSGKLTGTLNYLKQREAKDLQGEEMRAIKSKMFEYLEISEA